MKTLCFKIILIIIFSTVTVLTGNSQVKDKKFNILFIMSDDLRPELNCYETSYIKSPNIDQLAKNGTLFKRAYVQQAVCSASRASLLTGVRPNTTGVDYPYSEYFVNTFWPTHASIPEYFEAKNYAVRTFGKIHHGATDHIEAPHYVPKGRPLYALPENIALGGKKGAIPPYECADVPDEAYFDGMVAREAVEDIKELSGKEKPFFIAVGFIKPHVPYNAPKKYWDMYSEKEISLALNPKLPKSAPDYAISNTAFKAYKLPEEIASAPYGDFPEDYQRKLKHAYAACVSYVDAQVGKLMTQLEKSGQLENTIVVFISDHGYHLGEQSTWGKQTNFENGTRAPLIISVPGKANGTRINQLVEYVDIYPTLVELAGFKPADYLEGTSFLPLLDKPKTVWKNAIFSQFPRARSFEGYAMKTDKFRYVEWRNWKDDVLKSNELYDQKADPLEMVNLANDPKYKLIVSDLSKQLKAGWKAALPPGVVNVSNNSVAPVAVPWGPEAKRKGLNNDNDN
jgi:arylsulfatase A-like enzyme